MGRELKRVPLDFNYPIHKVWDGYINPYKLDECPYCKGIGLNKETMKLSNDWYSFYEKTVKKDGNII